ncbi:352_t:CDS:2 [Paraglomus occultum]|uniref:352_t:CDS:1 n=1 Tax=Paraglomus occultum TaxID=144539 RepID=A0A9N9GJJ6_9GLOM|nr:352_t:CDS:2 [Paraglomus occultum]
MMKSFIALFILFNIVNAELPGTWPPLDKPAPAVAGWSSLINATNVTNALILPPFTSCAQTSGYCRAPCGCYRDEILNCPTKKDWSLTFDDGPSDYTSRLVDFLNAQNVKATFYVVGSQVYRYPDVLKKIYDSGHEIGVHTWSHSSLTSLSNEQIIAEIKHTELAVWQVTGIATRTIRPPYGDCDDRVRDIIRQLGYKLVLWDSDTQDYLSNSNPKFDLNWIAGNFTQWTSKDKGKTGHISLEHDLFPQTTLAAERAVPILKKARYNMVTPATCNRISAYAFPAPSTHSLSTTSGGVPSNSTSKNNKHIKK